MLRAKPILTFSGYARSILLNGPRCGAADGTPCPSGDTDNCSSLERLPQSNRTTALPSPENSGGGQRGRLPAAEPPGSQIPAPKARAAAVREPSPVPPDTLLKAGAAALGFLSDLVGHGPPEWNGPKYMAGPTVGHPRADRADSEAAKKASRPKLPAESGTGLRKARRDAKIPDRAPGKGGSGRGGVVEEVCRALGRVKWGPAAEEELGKMGCRMDPYQANQALKRLQEDPSTALGLFGWLKGQPGFVHDGHTYTTMAGILGRARRFDEMDGLLGQMAGDGFRPTVVTFNRLIHSYGRANRPAEAVSVLERMRRAGVDPDRVTYCTLIGVHSRAGSFGSALTVYRSMLAAGIRPDAFTYGVVIDCLGRAGHLAAARGLFSEMAGRGCAPSLVTYNIMIAAHAKAGDLPSALGLYRDMWAAGFRPDRVSYSIVMEALGRRGHLAEAETVFSEMTTDGWVPDEPVFGQLVGMWGRAGDVDRARGWYSAMIGSGLRPNVPTCNSLLAAVLRSGRRGEARDLVREMLGFGLAPSLQTYTLLLGCCGAGPEVGFFGELMEMTGHPAHRHLLSTPEGGVRGHVCALLDGPLRGEERESRRGAVDAVVDFFYKAGMKEEAGSAWDAAAERGVYPEAVRGRGPHRWLVDLHVMSDGTAVTAVSRTLAWIRAGMVASGVGPSRVDIVTGWGRRSRVTGSSLVRRAVWDLLSAFRFPFADGGNPGCFVGCGEGLVRWLANPFVERMHLL